MKNKLIVAAIGSALAMTVSVEAAERLNVTQKNKLMTLSKNAHVQMETALEKQFNLKKGNTFLLKSGNIDKKGNSHARYQQMYHNVPVWSQQVLTHKKTSGNVKLTGSVLSKIDTDLNGSVTPKILTDEIINKIKNLATGKIGSVSKYTRENAELIIYFDEKFGKAHLAYHVELMAQRTGAAPARLMFIVDANSGFVYKKWDALMTIDATGPGGNAKTGQYLFGTDYPALPATDDGAGQCFLDNENVRAVSLNNSNDNSDNTAYEFTCPNNTFQSINGAFSPINDAFFFGNLAFDMFEEWYDTAPLPFQLSMKVHYSTNYENAFWDGQAMTFGDGDSNFYPLVDVNVSVHEISHGFTDFNSDLIYSAESGGMNEAFSDIAGEAAEYYWKGEVDWNIGADIMKNGDGLRFFIDPTLDGNSIAHYDDYYNGMDVHYSSGLYNRAYYLLSTTEGWNPRKAFDIFVLANQSYWTPDSTFSSGACGLISAASNLEYEWFDVYTALAAVGVQCTGNGVDEDQDGMSDISELILGFDPTNPNDGASDFDSDGLSNRVEINMGADPKNRDSDDDGLADGDEYLLHATSVINADSDDDGMSDGWEFVNGLNPTNPADAELDADEDSYSNLQEFNDLTDPNDSESYKLPAIMLESLFSIENGLALPNSEKYPSANANFTPTNTQASAGSMSLGAEDISDGQWVGMDWNITLEEDGEINFDFKTSTETNWDYFRVYINYSPVFNISGENDWTNLSLPLTAGSHIVTFTYEKDGSVSSGDDTVWLDNLSYTGLTFDSDGDGMVDLWEVLNGLDSEDPSDAVTDADEDGLTNLEEYALSTNPNSVDTDGDSLSDFVEVNESMTSPILADTDSDGVNDGLELSHSLDPLDAADGILDLDEDGVINSTEAKYGTSLGDATDYPELLEHDTNNFSDVLSTNWDVTSTESWLIESDSSGGMQLFAEPISNDMQAVAYYSNVFETGTLSFTANVDSESEKDFLEIYLDGVLLNSLSGQVSELIDIDIERGEHVIALVYNKNFGLSSSTDRVSIDNMSFMAPDADSDNDGLTNAEELVLGTNITIADTDEDGLTDGDEVSRGTDPLLVDSDGDSLSDSEEVTMGTDPLLVDSDGDSLSDSEEVAMGTDPLLVDSDGDSLSDSEEVTMGTNPLLSDTDADGLPDGFEAARGTNPLAADSDGDSLSDFEEFDLGTNPLSSDTDGDGIKDNVELANGTDPLLADSDGDGVDDKFDIFPLDSDRWSASGGGSLFFMLSVLPLLLVSRKRLVTVKK